MTCRVSGLSVHGVVGAWVGAWVLLASPYIARTEDKALSSDAATAARMALRIDAMLQERWQTAGIMPAPRSSDSEFLRRVTLDLTGRLPEAWQTRQFLADPADDKRARWIDALVHSPRFSAHMASVWRRILVPRSIEPDQVPYAVGLESWLRRQFAARVRFDNLVADLLTAQGDGTTGPALYYASLEAKPEKLAASTAAIFLGLQIQCAECHDHPFDHWKQRDFWGYAAFFAQLKRPNGSAPFGGFAIEDRESGEVTLPGTDQVVPPRFPTGELAPPDGYGSRRARLAIWMASRDNPYLPRAAVNWAWFLLFGRGLVHPVDDHGPHNPPSHPEILDALTDYFIDMGFDWTLLVQTLAMTEAYQLSSATSTATPPELFARHLPQTLPAETFYDILVQATAVGLPSRPSSSGAARFLNDPARQDFVMRMQAANSREPTHYEAGLPQALLLMNGPLIEQAVSPDNGPLLRALAAPFLSDEQRLEIIYLATLCRYPNSQERSIFAEQLKETDAASLALADVLWAIVNSSEFRMNN